MLGKNGRKNTEADKRVRESGMRTSAQEQRCRSKAKACSIVALMKNFYIMGSCWGKNTRDFLNRKTILENLPLEAESLVTTHESTVSSQILKKEGVLTH